MATKNGSWRIAAALILLGTLALAYAPVSDNDFVSFDDPVYVTENPQVRQGWTAEGWGWSLRTFHSGNWHPVTWWAHMTDVSLFGLRPAPHHWTNVALHALNALLLWIWIRWTIPWGARRPGVALLIALLFAAHPLRVESVAWVSERKDLLAGFFWLLAMLAHAWYVRRPRWTRAAATALAMALGSMAKPMLVTLPFVLLLLDFWPGRRIGTPERPFTLAAVRKLFVEKVALFALAAIASAVAIVSQRAVGAMHSLESLSPSDRVGQALLAYVGYLGKVVWPVDLAVIYPHPALRWTGEQLWLRAGPAGLALLLATVAALRVWRRHPALAVGWLWYLGTLVPVIGLVQVGNQAMADRYTYLPSIGLLLILGAAMTSLLDRRPAAARVVMAVGVLVVTLLTFATNLQVRTWRDSRTLFTHAIAAVPGNHGAHSALGGVLLDTGDFEEAHRHLTRALELNERDTIAHHNLGLLLAQGGDLPGAMQHLRRAVELNPDAPQPRTGLGDLLRRVGRTDDGIAQYRRALELDPEYRAAGSKLGIAYMEKGDVTAAHTEFARLVAADPTDPDARYNLAAAARRLGNLAEAESEYEEVLRLQPERARARFHLAGVLIERGDWNRAEAELLRTIESAPGVPDVHFRLGEVYRAQDRPDEANAQFRRALELDPEHEAASRALDPARRGGIR